jgi:hypothetical protein
MGILRVVSRNEVVRFVYDQECRNACVIIRTIYRVLPIPLGHVPQELKQKSDEDVSTGRIGNGWDVEYR